MNLFDLAQPVKPSDGDWGNVFWTTASGDWEHWNFSSFSLSVPAHDSASLGDGRAEWRAHNNRVTSWMGLLGSKNRMPDTDGLWAFRWRETGCSFELLWIIPLTRIRTSSMNLAQWLFFLCCFTRRSHRVHKSIFSTSSPSSSNLFSSKLLLCKDSTAKGQQIFGKQKTAVYTTTRNAGRDIPTKTQGFGPSNHIFTCTQDFDFQGKMNDMKVGDKNVPNPMTFCSGCTSVFRTSRINDSYTRTTWGDKISFSDCRGALANYKMTNTETRKKKHHNF